MIITGNNLKLVPISYEDTSDIIRWRNHVRKNFIDREFLTVDKHTGWLNEMIKTGKAEQFIIWTNQNERIGSVFLKDIDRINKRAEYGIFIGKESAQSKGYGSEAAKLMVQYGFDNIGLHKIMLRVFAFNKKAIKSYENAGFVQEGYLKDEVCIEDQFYDIVLMGILNKVSANNEG